MNPKVRNAVTDFVKMVKEGDVASKIDFIRLYGSALGDEYKPEKSDVDLFIVSADKGVYERILDYQNEVCLRYGIPFSIVFDTEDEFEKEMSYGSSFLKNLLTSGELLYGRG
ncbi:MAG: nucleotidyltransferase domain-containing protein [Deltaproteobacteria bacterium]|nr:nucleotidyltransferase domain-containing protein [Deltaproteobacteria bacterium]